MKLATVIFGLLTSSNLLAETESKIEDSSTNNLAEKNPSQQNGVAWYSTWGTALAEAKRSQRPIFFLATPCQREGVPGIFSASYAQAQGGLINTPEFLEISRKFVCVRLATFERPEHLDMVRFLLKNETEPESNHSAFVVFSPDGETLLTESAPTPLHAANDKLQASKDLHRKLKAIAEKHPAQAPTSEAVMEDFHSFAQALRTSAADQRLLFYIVAPQGNRMPYWKKAQAVINDPEVLGGIHVDFIGATDSQWHKVIKRDSMQVGYFIIQPGEFGRGGLMVAELPLRTPLAKIKTTLLKVNEHYHQTVSKRNDAEHLQRAKELGVTYKSAVPVPNAHSAKAAKP